MDETQNSSNIIVAIVLVSILLAIFILIMVVIFNAMNSVNLGSGTTNTASQSDVFLNGKGSTNSLSVNSNINNPTCSITSVTDLNGNIIPSSNYTVNNCQVTYP